MDIKEQISNLAKEMIKFDIANAKDLNKNKQLPSTGCCWFVLGFIVFMNVISLLFTKLLADTFSNIFLLSVLLILIIFEIRRISKNHKENERVKLIKQRHQEYIDDLNKLNNAHPELCITPWWNYINGLESMQLLYRQSLSAVWTPFERIEKRNNSDAMYVASPYTGFKDITGFNAMKLLNNNNYRIIYNGGMNEDENYKVAELCMLFTSVETINKTSTKSESEIQNELNAYRQQLDTEERWNNLLDGHQAVTNETRYYSGTIDKTEYHFSSLERSLRESKREEKIRKTSTSVSSSYVETTYCYVPVGIVFTDKNDIFKGIMLLKENAKETELYYTYSDTKKIIDMSILNKASNVYNGKLICLHLWNYVVGELDPVQPIPKTFTVEEWAAWIYAHYYEGK